MGIPADAQKILFFCESSHWDPNWLHTSEWYYQRFIKPNLDLVLTFLQEEPRRIYSVECMFFFRMYWERSPEKQNLIRSLVNNTRLRLTSSGVTTADTLIPEEETILRDFLLGQEWLRQNGMLQEPSLAYFTDSFGCSPFLPTLLRAAGFNQTAFTRLDGMYFPGADWNFPGHFPLPGSTAEQLLKRERSLDFIWRDANQSEVLCHWNAFTYWQGDLLTSRGSSRFYLFPFFFPDRSEGNVARRINQYIRQLSPLSRTPYLLCPIGVDFVKPIPNLVSLFDRYNHIRYPHTGVWAVNTGMDDYLSLVSTHQEQLPRLEIEPNPYWTGFYSSRPALKDRCRSLAQKLIAAEKLTLLPPILQASLTTQATLSPAWWIAATSNHHDFITGTATDAVVETEQSAWLEQAENIVDREMDRLSAKLTPKNPPTSTSNKAPCHRRDGSYNLIDLPDLHIRIPMQSGGEISAAWIGMEELSPILLAGSNTLISLRDSGGLWRMGHEFSGGHLRESPRDIPCTTPVEVEEIENCLILRSRVLLDRMVLQRTLRFFPDESVIFGNVTGIAAPGRTVCLRFHLPQIQPRAWMVQPGGIVQRPLQKIYQPTFWSMQTFAAFKFAHRSGGMVFLSRTPTAVAATSDGKVDLVALRNATAERAYGMLPLPSNPVKGHEKNIFSFDYAFLYTPDDDLKRAGVDAQCQHASRLLWNNPIKLNPIIRKELEGQVLIESNHRSGCEVIALKPAETSRGVAGAEWILRLRSYLLPQSVRVKLRDYPIESAVLCDARERPLAQVMPQDGWLLLDFQSTILTVHLRLDLGN